MKKILFIVCVFACVTTHLNAQKKSYIHLGVGADYYLLNDRTVGDIPMKGITGSISLGYDRRSPSSMWGVGMSGGFGFANTYRFPSIEDRVADSYYMTLGGYYLHRVNDRDKKWEIYVGGKADFHLYVQQILSFANSEANYFSHSGIGPSVKVKYPFNIMKKDWMLTAGFDMDVAAVVVRPSYTMPFVNDGVRNVRIATLNDYGNYSTRVSMWHEMKTGNAMEIVYRWRYDCYTRENTVRHAMHSLSYILYFNL